MQADDIDITLSVTIDAVGTCVSKLAIHSCTMKRTSSQLQQLIAKWTCKALSFPMSEEWATCLISFFCVALFSFRCWLFPFTFDAKMNFHVSASRLHWHSWNNTSHELSVLDSVCFLVSTDCVTAIAITSAVIPFPLEHSVPLIKTALTSMLSIQWIWNSFTLKHIIKWLLHVNNVSSSHFSRRFTMQSSFLAHGISHHVAAHWCSAEDIRMTLADKMSELERVIGLSQNQGQLKWVKGKMLSSQSAWWHQCSPRSTRVQPCACPVRADECNGSGDFDSTHQVTVTMGATGSCFVIDLHVLKGHFRGEQVGLLWPSVLSITSSI